MKKDNKMKKDNELEHVGVLGMRWGVHTDESGGGSGGGKGSSLHRRMRNAIGDKLTIKQGTPGRDIPLRDRKTRNKTGLSGGNNLTKARNWLLGDAETGIANVPFLNKKYNSLNKADRAKFESRTRGVLSAISLTAIGSLVYMYKKG
jgi:hypothetical protein